MPEKQTNKETNKKTKQSLRSFLQILSTFLIIYSLIRSEIWNPFCKHASVCELKFIKNLLNHYWYYQLTRWKLTLLLKELFISVKTKVNATLIKKMYCNTLNLSSQLLYSLKYSKDECFKIKIFYDDTSKKFPDKFHSLAITATILPKSWII